MTRRKPIILIPLTRGKFAEIDAADASLVTDTLWSATHIGRRWYAIGRINGEQVLMHRLITNAAIGMDVDHIDGDGLNNKRDNLRIATRSQNMANVSIGPRSKSGFKGVSWHAGAGRWRATTISNGRQVHLGYFDNVEDAARAYDAKAREIFGEFARLNFPDESAA